jgi:mannose-6-phosphate isomerase
MNTVDKPWGREEWLVLNDKYCLKRMYIEQGKKISLQYHEVKKETMILESGLCDLILNEDKILMEIGVAYTIQPEDIHRLISYSDSVILEVSTPEVEDVVRLEDDYDRPKYSRRKGDKKSQIEGENT